MLFPPVCLASAAAGGVGQTGAVSSPAPDPDTASRAAAPPGSGLLAALFLYVLPVTVVSGLLALAGLGGLALALLGVEAVVAGLTLLVRRRPARPGTPSRRPWLVPLLMVGILVAIVVLAQVVYESR